MRTRQERFEAKINKTDTCWLWLGKKNRKGYGQFYYEGYTQRMAHRVSYSLYRGPIPVSLQIDHLCRNTACVNPDHLEPVTCKENIGRGLRARGKRTHCRRGHLRSPESTYVSVSPKGYTVTHCIPCRKINRNSR